MQENSKKKLTKFCKIPSLIVLVPLGFVTIVLSQSCLSRNFENPFLLRRETPDEAYTQSKAGSAPTPFKFDPSDTSCGGYPRLTIETMPRSCVGIIHVDTTASFQPRVIMEIPGRPNEFLFSDFAGWSQTAGKIWYLKGGKNFTQTKPILLLNGLSVVHQLSAGPGSRIYFSEDGAIKAFSIARMDEAIKAGKTLSSSDLSKIIDKLPPMYEGGKKNSMHPIKHFTFDNKSNIYVNIGAYTDHCNAFVGKNCTESTLSIGSTSNPLNHGGVIRKYSFTGNLSYGWNEKYKVIAQGLRNSMGMLFTKEGHLLQIENGRDFSDSTRPFEEVNLIMREEIEGLAPAMHFGWPYCYDYSSKSDEWANFNWNNSKDFCNPTANKLYRPPYVLLPPHSAPLGIIQYSGKMFANLAGKILITLHGYRSPGHRIVALHTDPATGLPTRLGKGSYREDNPANETPLVKNFPATPASTEMEDVIAGWYDAPGIRPKGAPVSLTEATDGSIWFTDDKNHAILRMVTTSDSVPPLPPAKRANAAQAYSDVIKESPSFRKAYFAVKEKVLTSPQCAGCHDGFVAANDTIQDEYKMLRYIVGFGNWIVPGSPEESLLYTKLIPVGNAPMPPIDQKWSNNAQGQAAVDAVKQLINELPKAKSLWRVKLNKSPTITGLTRGKPGNGPCGVIPAGKYLYVLSSATAQLGGKQVHEILVGSPSAIANLNNCKSYNAFYVPVEDIEPLL